LTPLRNGGAELDLDAFDAYLIFLRDAGIDGILSLGTTGEGMALSVPERKKALERYAAGPLPVIAHCGAQTTAQTVELAEHAASLGVEGVAVIAPPYFPLDEDELLAHFTAAARACAPTP
jgi:dihydrodipicolinate synthase/N-acetylneuraminate lyase